MGHNPLDDGSFPDARGPHEHHEPAAHVPEIVTMKSLNRAPECGPLANSESAEGCTRIDAELIEDALDLGVAHARNRLEKPFHPQP